MTATCEKPLATMDAIRNGEIFRNPYDAVIISEYLYTIWISRNELVFKKSPQILNAITHVFISRIVLRIKSDFKRMKRQEFNTLWSNKNIKTSCTSRKVHIDFPKI